MKSGIWAAAEDALLRELFPNTPTPELSKRLDRTACSIYHRAYSMGLRKSAEYLASPAACRLRRGDKVGASFRFMAGHVPANKGLRRPGWGPGRMKATQFKPGALRGKALQNFKPLGTERLSKDGYLERKVHNDIPAGASRQEANRLRMRRWRAVHLLVWEAAHGALPKGHALVFINGDKRDIRLDNLQLITRADLMKRNTIYRFPPELVSTIKTLGSLKRQINKRVRDAEQQTDRPA